MSHYFKRDSNDQGQESSPVVPIFNSKKRRIKQALYSNPSSSQTNNFKSSFSNSTTQYNSGNSFTNSLTTQYNSGFCPKKASETSQESQGTTAYRANLDGHESARKRPMQNKTDARPLLNTAPKSLPCMPKPRPQFGVGGISTKNMKVEQQGNNQMKPNGSVINKTSYKSPREQHTNDSSNFPKLVKTKSKIDNSSKFYTATIKTVMDWEEFRDKTTAIFEVYGVLESAVSTNSSGNAKTFVLKDNTRTMRCTFWEMDRPLPRLIRGRNYRCVGSIDRKTKTFNCATVRPANLVEVHSASTSIASSEVAMQSYIATFKED